jgi:hypothetical protein
MMALLDDRGSGEGWVNAARALLNLVSGNDINKATMVAAGAIPLLLALHAARRLGQGQEERRWGAAPPRNLYRRQHCGGCCGCGRNPPTSELLRDGSHLSRVSAAWALMNLIMAGNNVVAGAISHC